MTHAAGTTIQTTVPNAVPIAVLGTDALRAALPATPVQLAHACLQAGFANVIPASWGDELIASAVLRRLPLFGDGPVIQCSCPIVAHRLLTVGGDLRPMMLALVSPPVAVSRYLRALSQPARTRITYIGSCPGAIDDSIDIRMTPDALIAMLAERQILLEDQPRVFESVIPPDRRRFRSQPGGVPSAETLWNEAGSRTLVELDGEDLVAELAQHLLVGKNILIDASTCLGCVCSGASVDTAPADARAQVVLNEPPRAATAIVEDLSPIELDSEVPAVSRTPIDVAAISAAARPMYLVSPGSVTAPSFDQRNSPSRGSPVVADPRPARPSGPVSSRTVTGAATPARDNERRSLPRTYVARRKSPTRSIQGLSSTPAEPFAAQPAVSQQPHSVPEPAHTTVVPIDPIGLPPLATSTPTYAEPRFSFPRASTPEPARAASWPAPSRRVIAGFIATVVVVIVLSVVVGAYIGRALMPTRAPTPASIP